ncbi:helicase, type I site-specific restriction-modification system restriction subunit [Methanomethylovorans hollandica DSM 15978]|uniref:Helicase, type I site-specific restriction-modification system restriction subunit n=1 Tax=Methanomethylovorans hollandica (strain DSM 15978 / NBRC 107637 / DMS1) TaxID=867904 RepID=L0KV66_METHD|nr:DEAD/DEAH box helicase family protein [Methanomethylovorans hollandica]AGB48595.1 helicase, type I site-specific restriction-modification system restriction subunit [Methanomethylovorans hollandica DSM 15978]
MSHNQSPEQEARNRIDGKLEASGWIVQERNRIDWSAADGIAVKEYFTDVGPADYVLFVDKSPVGIIEAKKEEEGHRLTVVEEQSGEYATSKLKYLNNDPLPFVYESTGTLTRFTDHRDPKPRSRPVFSFHRPETFREWLKEERSLRNRLLDIPGLRTEGLHDCQIRAINNLERSFKENHPRALIQMATGSGKTYTAVTFIYRLLKYADAKRVLFLVDTRNLGKQAEQEFMAYTPNDDNRKFTELYNVQRLRSSYMASDSQVCISTIQRLYSILKGEELDEETEETNPAESGWQPKEPLPVVYNEKVPIEQFDFIVIDECHRSIYNLWKQVLDYFDAFLIGLTATPDKRTFGFFNENVVSEYSYEDAVADGVNVGYDVYTIETEITKKGAEIKAREFVDKREKLSRRKRWEQLDEAFTYTGRQLDRDVVNPSQIRNVIRAFRDKLPEIFPGRQEIPKTLIFAKTDSHADDIIQIVREEFGEGNAFCKKVTYKAEEDADSVLSALRNDYNPRIAVTVDMIATGTDVKPLECLLFMRDVKSRNYFEQMKGRGTRVMGYDDLRKVTPSVVSAKTHFVIVDAVGVTKSMKTDSRPLERKKGAPLKDLLAAVTFGAQDEDLYVSLANRLARLDKMITPDEKIVYAEKASGKTINQTIRDLLNAYNPDVIEGRAFEIREIQPDMPQEKASRQAQQELIDVARFTFTGELNEYIENVRRVHEQIIDTVNIDVVTRTEWDKDAVVRADELVRDFREYLEAHKDEITALRIFYNQPYQRRDVTFAMIKEVLERLKLEKPLFAPLRVWQAYEQLEKVNGNSPKKELTALVSLIRRVTEIDPVLTAYDLTVNRNFRDWVFKKQAGTVKFNEEQMQWLRMIKDYIIDNVHMELDDLDYRPFDREGSRSRMYQLFGDEMNSIISELNEALAA